MQTDIKKAAGNSEGNGSELSRKQILTHQAVEGLIYLPFTKCPQRTRHHRKPINLLGPVHLPPATEAVDILNYNPPVFVFPLFSFLRMIVAKFLYLLSLRIRRLFSSSVNIPSLSLPSPLPFPVRLL